MPKYGVKLVRLNKVIHFLRSDFWQQCAECRFKFICIKEMKRDDTVKHRGKAHFQTYVRKKSLVQVSIPAAHPNCV